MLIEDSKKFILVSMVSMRIEPTFAQATDMGIDVGAGCGLTVV